MVGQIGPLVQVGRRKTGLAFHVAGGIAGGATIGVLIGFFGLLLRAIAGDGLDTVFLVVVPFALAYTALVDLGVLRLGYVKATRQTPAAWPCALGHYPGIFGWGFDLGLAVTTRLPYQSLLVLPLAALLSGSLPAAVAIMGAYGAARALAVAVAVQSAHEDFAAACDAIETKVGTLRRVVGAISFVTAAALLLLV